MRDAESSPVNGSTCPVKHNDNVTPSITATNATPLSNWWKLMPSSLSPSLTKELNESARESTCPVSKASSGIIPASLEEAARYAQTPQADQAIPLALDRQVSSIPRGGVTSDDSVKVPEHQLIHDENDKEKKTVGRLKCNNCNIQGHSESIL